MKSGLLTTVPSCSHLGGLGACFDGTHIKLDTQVKPGPFTRLLVTFSLDC